jgi:hypothetical protein
MPGTLSSVFEFLLYSVKVVSHILLLLVHNLIFIAIAVALLYGIFRLCRHGLQQLWHLRGGGPPGQSAPEDKPEDSPE